MTLVGLYLRSRVASVATYLLAGLGGAAWVLSLSTDIPCHSLLIRLIFPFSAAVVIGFSARSPFGDAEEAVGNPLLWLRTGHLGGVLLCGMIVFALAGTADPGTEAAVIMIRNLLGFTGLMLVGVTLTSVGKAWIMPFTWGAIAFLAAMPDSTAGWWAWPVRPADHAGAFVAAVMVAVVGLLMAGLKGTRDQYVVEGGIVE
jgi:hypothetical protein